MLEKTFSNELLKQLESDLQRVFNTSSSLKMDLTTRLLYSTDASIYKIQPLGVVFPRNYEEMSATIALCSKYHIPVLARGAGSSLGGQAIGEALIMDCSRYLDRIIEIDPERRLASVQPGVIIDDLNKELNKYGLQFGPDPASSERATIGGSVANNATGAHSIRYGMAGDHVDGMDLILSDGTNTNFGLVSVDKAISLSRGQSIQADIYRVALQIRERDADEIKQRWPKTWRNASGYNLNYLIPWSASKPPAWENCQYPPLQTNEINLSHLIAGSEGTLGIIKTIRLRLVPVPKYKVLSLLTYNSIEEACDNVPDLLSFQPAAIELIPRTILSAAKSIPAYASKAKFLSEVSEAILVVEFSGNEFKNVLAQAQRLNHDSVLVESIDQQKEIWSIRKAGLGILQSKPGDIKPVAFIEDVAVPVDQLGRYIRELNYILSQYAGTKCEIYAHASAGCLHVRPLLNLKKNDSIKNMRAIAYQTVELANSLGGTISGEHGDGIARAEWIEKQYGERLIRAFKELKQAADPFELFNPGKKVSLSDVNKLPPMDNNLRYGVEYKTQTWNSVFNFTREEGLAGAIEQCNGAGVCRKSGGVMCPSFQASNDEMHSTRGRSNLLRAMISGEFPDMERAEKTVFEALDLCLACKGCKSECPSSVDVAKLKYEFLARYYSTHHRKLRDYIFGYIEKFSKAGYPFRGFINILFGNIYVKNLADRLFGIAKERPLPLFAKKSLRQNIGKKYYRISQDDYGNQNQAILLVDSFTEFFFPEIGLTTINVLERIGYSVTVLPILGAGRTLISKGFLVEAKNHASRLISHLKLLDPMGKAAIVGIEPSEIYTLRDEYLDFFFDDPFVSGISNRSWMIDEFLVRPDNESDGPKINRLINFNGSGIPSQANHIGFHGHCYQKTRPPSEDGYPIGVDASIALLKILGYEVEMLDSSCCGMAGAFGYESEHYQFSIDVSNNRLIPSIAQLPPETILVTPGFSCHSQINDRTQRKVFHPIQMVDASGKYLPFN